MISSLRTGGSIGKVLRSADGLNQVVCIRTSDSIAQKTETICTTQKSTNGKKLPVFNPPIRMG